MGLVLTSNYWKRCQGNEESETHDRWWINIYLNFKWYKQEHKHFQACSMASVWSGAGAAERKEWGLTQPWWPFAKHPWASSSTMNTPLTAAGRGMAGGTKCKSWGWAVWRQSLCCPGGAQWHPFPMSGLWRIKMEQSVIPLAFYDRIP